MPLGPDVVQRLLGDNIVATLRVPQLVKADGRCVCADDDYIRMLPDCRDGLITLSFVASSNGASLSELCRTTRSWTCCSSECQASNCFPRFDCLGPQVSSFTRY